jgi:hypothetical protein
LPIVPAEAVAQRERVLHAVVGHARPLDHLRLDSKVLIGPEEGVVDEVAVIARDVGRLPDGIDGLQIRLGHEPEDRPALLSMD